MSLLTDRCTILIYLNRIMDGFRVSPLYIKINEGTDLPAFEERIGWHVIHSRVQTHVFDVELWHMYFQFMKCNQSIDRIMPSGAVKPEKQRKIRVEFFVVTGKVE